MPQNLTVTDTYSRSETQETGSTTNVYIKLNAMPLSEDTTGKAPPLQLQNTTNSFIVNLTSPYFGSYGSMCSNGSTYTNPNNPTNLFMVRVAGVWRFIAIT